MPLDENEAWEQLRAAILRCQADPTPTEDHLAEVRRCSRAWQEACGVVFPPDEDEPSEREAA